MRIPKILGGGLLLLALALTNPACGSEGAAAQPEAPTPAAAAARAEASGRTTEPAPTRPQRLDHLLRTPTAEPEAVAVRASSEEVRTETKGGTSGAPAAEQTGGTDPLVPEDARFTDQVLLQDIYERIDLEQFALDPRDPITRPEIRKEAGEHHLWSTMPHPMVHQHPYLHIFPDLERIVEVQRETGLMRDITYNPLTQNLRAMERNLRHEAEGDNRRSSFSYDRLEDLTGLKDRMTYFIYHPWFEPVFPNDGTRRVQIGELDRAPLGNYELDGPGPYWFGNNSTRGVLAETVAQLIREARKPGVTPAQRVWWNEESEKYRTAFPSMTWYDHGGNWTGEMRDWTIEEFIRTTVMSEETIQLPRDRKSGRTDTKYWNDGINRRQNPKVEWEILHPRLPILRITAHAERELPLQNNPEGNYWDTGGSSRLQRLLRDLAAATLGVLPGPQPVDHPIPGGHGELLAAAPPVLRGLRDPHIGVAAGGRMAAVGSGDALPKLLAPHRLHAAPDHRPGGADGPQFRGPGTRHLQPGAPHHPLGGPGAHPDGAADHEGEANIPHRAGQHLSEQRNCRVRQRGPPLLPRPRRPQRGVAAARARDDGPPAGAGDRRVAGVRHGGVRLVENRRKQTKVPEPPSC